jgi:arylsulfatase A-like enzyme
VNLLFIIADQWRADSLGCAGHPVVQTPNLDRLARESTRFEQCFVQTAPCGPSRMCIYTGRYLCSHRAVHNKTPLIDAEDNLGRWLREGGHDPHLIGYNDYAVDPRTLPEDDPRTRSLNYDNVLPGFETLVYHEYDCPEYFEDLRAKGYPEWLLNHKAVHQPNVPEEGPGEHLALRYPAHYKAEDCEARFLTNKAIEHINARKDSGWVLNVNYIKPHPPSICSAPFNDMYDPADMPAVNRDSRELDADHPYQKRITENPRLEADRDLRETQANYFGMITEVDTSLGLLFDALEAAGQWEDTVIVFSSDHGEYLGDHYLTGKGHFYDAGIHVPLIVRDPSAAADATRGESLTGFVESVDITPTILDLMGVEIPDRIQGKSLVPRVRGQASGGKAEVHFEKDFRHVPGIDPDLSLLWMVRDDDYKYVQFAEASIPPLLYDLRDDPCELNNLSGSSDHQSVMLDYAQKLLRWRMQNEDQRMEHWASQFKG